MSEGSGGAEGEVTGLGKGKSLWQTGAHANDRGYQGERNGLTEGDDFSSLIFGVAPGTSTTSLKSPAGEPNRAMFDDIFTQVDPHTSYQNIGIDFLDLFDGTNSRMAASTISHDSINVPQSSFQDNISVGAPGNFHSFMMDPHPGILIPTRTVSSHTDSQSSAYSPPRHPQLNAPSLSSGAVGRPPINTEAFESANLLTRRVSLTTVPQRQSRPEPWSRGPALEAPESSLPSSAHESGGPQSQSKPTTSTLPTSSRRKSTEHASVELPTSAVRLTKTSHNIIEKRYRLKLNDKIIALRNAVPALRASASASEDILQPGRGIASKLNKGTVLTKATEYIQRLEHEKHQLEQEVAALKEQLAASKRSEESKQNFEKGGAAYNVIAYCDPISSETGMISPESCTSLMSPEAEGTKVVEEDIAAETLGLRVVGTKSPGY